MSPKTHEQDPSPARSRRALLRAAGSALTLTASGILLPESVIAGTKAIEAPAPSELHAQRARRRRHRRRRRHTHETPAYATVVLPEPQVILSNTLMTIRLNTVLTSRHFVFNTGESRVVATKLGNYSIDLFLNWSGSSAGTWTARLVLTRQGLPSDVLVHTSTLTTAPTPTVLHTNLILKRDDTLQVISQQNSATPAHVSAGTMVITRQG